MTGRAFALLGAAIDTPLGSNRNHNTFPGRMMAILKYITYSKASYLAKVVILLMITTRTKKMATPTRIMKVTIATRLPITTPTLTNDSASSGFISKGCGDGVELS